MLVAYVVRSKPSLARTMSSLVWAKLRYVATRLAGTKGLQDALARNGSFAAPEFVEAGRKVQEAVQAGCFEEGFNGIEDRDAQALMASGKAAMRLMGDRDQSGLKAANPELLNTSLAMMNFPEIEGGKGGPTEMIGGPGQALAVSSKAPPEAGQAIIDLLSSEEYGKLTTETGFISALAGYDQFIKEPKTQEAAKLFADAESVQLFWDQALTPQLVQAHLNTSQALFGLSMTPEEAAKQVEDVAQTELKPTQ